jgi:hypothetical protein
VDSPRITLLYLDDDPVATYARVLQRTEDAATKLTPAAAATAEVVITTPLRTIVPCQDWYPQRAVGPRTVVVCCVLRRRRR